MYRCTVYRHVRFISYADPSMYRTYVHNVAEFHATEAGKSSTCQQRLPINREPLAIFLYASELEEKGYIFFPIPFLY